MQIDPRASLGHQFLFDAVESRRFVSGTPVSKATSEAASMLLARERNVYAYAPAYYALHKRNGMFNADCDCRK